MLRSRITIMSNEEHNVSVSDEITYIIVIEHVKELYNAQKKRIQ